MKPCPSHLMFFITTSTNNSLSSIKSHNSLSFLTEQDLRFFLMALFANKLHKVAKIYKNYHTRITQLIFHHFTPTSVLSGI